MSSLCVLALLCLMTLTRSAPLTCEELLRPLDRVDLHGLEGRRALVAASLSHPPFMERLKQRETASIDFSSNSSDTSISFRRSTRFDNVCHYGSYNISLQGSSFIFDNITTTFTHTCDDCVLLSFDVKSEKRQHFYLFSRRRQLQTEEIEEFKAQVKCLNMPPPVVMDPTKELCPEETSREAAAPTEEKAEGQKD
ncbi:alpha-1-acid glycoprotein 1-like [Larimichthys crocea]|uniref:alpha-1-acid glycoprotein 1-like n=1 Tax=Larimichthys crocea TaxID=215358 RepID=UPI000F5F6E8A|nr:alpha-1-acid glycoprotein 1-like [Larimichthys crocea]